MRNVVPTGAKTVMENILVIVQNWPSVLTVESLYISRKIANFCLRSKSKARLEITFLSKAKARARSTQHM